jgi:integrase
VKLDGATKAQEPSLPPELEGLLQEFKQANAITAASLTCQANYRTVKRFLFLNNAMLQGADLPAVLTAPNIERYLAGLLTAGKTAKTVRNVKASLSRYCGWAKRQRILSSNPCNEIDPPPLAETIPSALTRADLAKCLRIGRREGMECEVALAAYTGLRVSEMRRLKWADVDLPGRRITVHKRKNRRPLVTGIHRFLLRRLIRQRRRYPRCEYVFPGGRDRLGGREGAGPWRRSGMRNKTTWCEMMLPLQEEVAAFGKLPKGSVGRGWHIFRHTFATEAFRRGVDVRLVQKWMGHRCINMTLRYTHVADGYDAEIERL